MSTASAPRAEAPPLTGTAPQQGSPAVRGHSWRGYPCESRLVRSPAPALATIVLVGGAFQTKESWGRLEQEFLAVADVLTVDLPGWGRGAVLPEHYGADFLADALCHVLDDLGLASVNVVAGSYGTAVAYHLAQRHPARVRRMALVGTMTSIPDHSRAAIQRTLEHLVAGRTEEFADGSVALMMNHDRTDQVASALRVRRFLRRRLLNLHPSEVEQHVTNTRRLLRHAPLRTDRPPTVPVLVATGEHDHFTTPELCRELAATCPDSWFARLAHADHMLPVERSVEVADLINRFLAGLPIVRLPYCRSVERVGRP
ncbi:alpha/beta fold hydrolase [Kitasatospora sp. NPDC101176]|uniref:alpha/beta fold hydrolase n=1 Tax=Kitasatospora sp. NPDC101176 TaxID=3364099 RepID=UPI00381F123A